MPDITLQREAGITRKKRKCRENSFNASHNQFCLCKFIIFANSDVVEFTFQQLEDKALNTGALLENTEG